MKRKSEELVRKLDGMREFRRESINVYLFVVAASSGVFVIRKDIPVIILRRL